jgi:type VI secretion system secreted protein Hcp
LYVDGVQGPSSSKTGFIDILSFSWGVAQSIVDMRTASGATKMGHGRADFINLIITKKLDKTTPLLFDHCASGDLLKEVYLLYDKPVGDKQDDFFRIYLKDVIVTSVQLSSTQETPSESVSFAFGAVEVAYKPEKANGTLDAAISKGYSIETLSPNFAAPTPMG